MFCLHSFQGMFSPCSSSPPELLPKFPCRVLTRYWCVAWKAGVNVSLVASFTTRLVAKENKQIREGCMWARQVSLCSWKPGNIVNRATLLWLNVWPRGKYLILSDIYLFWIRSSWWNDYRTYMLPPVHAKECLEISALEICVGVFSTGTLQRVSVIC